MEECKLYLDVDDFSILMMGAGVGYFLIGYFVSTCIFKYRNNNINGDEVIFAHRV